MNGLYLFTMLRIPVYLSLWYVILVVYWSWSIGDARLAIIWNVCVTVSILVHEYGHGLVARAYRLAPRIQLAFGGLCAHTPAKRDRHEALILIAGPGAGFILGGLTYLVEVIWYATSPETMTNMSATALYWMLWINLVWGGLNLAPLWPLDGGRLFRLALIQRLRPLLAEKITHWTGIGLSLVVALYAYQAGWRFLAALAAFGAYLNYKQLASGQSSGTIRPKNRFARELLEQAEAAFEAEDWREAERLSHHIRSLDGVDDLVLTKVWRLLALSIAAQDEHARALSYFKRAKRTAELAEAHARSLEALGRASEAADVRAG